MKDFADQNEATAEHSRLKFRSESLRARLHAAQGIAIAPPALSGDILADITALEIHVKELESKLPMDAPAASNLSPAAAASAAKTLTEKILAAKGVTKLSDLPPAKCD